MVEKQFTVTDAQGIHARPASILVSTATKFKSDVTLIHKGNNVNLKSILGVMSLGIGIDEEFIISANGIDEQDALNALEEALINGGLTN
ncbi:phosphocarrier protein HPr [Sporosarcina sp. ANT_H38]|uniref:phosphocarrier protein HPr n=1 Tax=Sporosarcina sp. ANT_H38 TaxID=2597358 RepID=UPI0011F26BB4|nr:phosphocarrier protein HPr [Sporosarcina sp. ANT_H38]KAA0965637.1 phosphocarrier protein HPr [Sporosarcina sp. ANT_H38]